MPGRSATVLREAAPLLFLSGLTALIYQSAWFRELRLVFGVSTGANAAVVAVFMGGLGAGGLVLGRRADRARSPLLLYARLEAAVALFALATPLLVRLARAVYLALGGSANLGLLATPVRLALATLVLAVPTFVMGGTLPAAAAAVARSADAGRRRVAAAYGINTAGAVAGVLLATFVVIERLGVLRSLWLAAALNLAVALAAFRLAVRLGPMQPAPVAPGDGQSALGPATATSTGATAPSPARAVPLPLVATAAAAAGFSFFLLEVVWYRMLAPLLGGSTYTFGAILGMALLGTGAGALAYAAGAEVRRPTRRGFALLAALEAAAILLPFALGDRIAVAAALLRGAEAAGFAALVATWLAILAVVVLPAALVAGYQFPMLIALSGQGRGRVGHEVGVVYAANTAGAILGSLGGGFGLMPLLGAPGCWRLAGFLLLGLALATLLAARRAVAGEDHRTWPVLVVVAAAVLLGVTPGPSSGWRHSGIGAGRFITGTGVNGLRSSLSRYRRGLIWNRDGVESDIALWSAGGHALVINGKSDGSCRFDVHFVMSPLIGYGLHPDPRRALVIGLGTGNSAGWLAQMPEVETVDVIELEPAVRGIAEACALTNEAVLDNPKVRLIRGDGREHLATSTATYDLIYSEPSNPFRAGVASLFAREFYQAARQRLAPSGLFLQWVQAYELDAESALTAYATLASVFASVEVWSGSGQNLLFVASEAPFDHQLARVFGRVAPDQPLARAMRKAWGVTGVAGFYSGFVAGPGLADTVRGAAVALHTDDRPRLEFAFARTVGRSQPFGIEDLRREAARRGAARPSVEGQDLDWGRVEEQRQARYVHEGRKDLPEVRPADAAAAARVRARIAYANGDPRAALAAWESQPEPPQNPIDRILLADSEARIGGQRGLGYIDALMAEHPVEGNMVRALARRRQPALAAEDLAQALRLLRREVWVYLPLVERAIDLAVDLGRRDPTAAVALDEALSQPFAIDLARDERAHARLAIGLASPDFDRRCRELLAPFEPNVLWEGWFLRARLRCYQHHGLALARSARRDLARHAAAEAPELGALLPAPAP